MRMFASANNTSLPQSHPVGVPATLSLEDDLRARQAAWEKQTRSLEKLRETFEAEKLTCNPARYSFLRDQIEQLAAVVAHLKTAMDEAEAKHAQFLFAEQKRATEAATQQKRQELMSELNILDTKISSLDIAFAQIPDQKRMLQGRRNMILTSLANL